MKTCRKTIISSCCLYLLVFAVSAKAQEWLLTVPSTAPWFDTGVDLQAGQQLSITANGLVNWATGSPGINADGVGEGWDGTLRHPGTVAPSAIWLSLIGKVGGDLNIGSGNLLPEGIPGKGAGFVGSAYEGTLPTGGRLFLGFNDTTANFGDNGGAFSVNVVVVPEPATTALLLLGLPFALMIYRSSKRN